MLYNRSLFRTVKIDENCLWFQIETFLRRKIAWLNSFRNAFTDRALRSAKNYEIEAIDAQSVCDNRAQKRQFCSRTIFNFEIFGFRGSRTFYWRRGAPRRELMSFAYFCVQIQFLLDWTWSLGLRGISRGLNKAAENPENSMLRFLLSIQKTLFQNFRSSRFGWTIQKSFFRDKNPGRLHVTFFDFPQRPKVGSIILLTIENMEKRHAVRHVQEVSVPDERHHTSHTPDTQFFDWLFGWPE